MNQAKTFQFGRKGFLTLGLTVFTIAYNVNVLPAIMPAIVANFNASVGYFQSILVLFSLTTASFAVATYFIYSDREKSSSIEKTIQ